MSPVQTVACQNEDDHVRLGDNILPAGDLRLCGPEFADDQYFLDSARAEANRLVRYCGVNSETRLLDIGCGMGRLPIGILSAINAIDGYCGVDVSPRCIDWCNRHINVDRPGFTFVLLDVRNERYNAQGVEIDQNFRLPFASQSFDVIYLYSVFSHMLPDDMRACCNEFRRIIKPAGYVFLTAFVEEHVPDVSVNPDSYRMEWSGPLHCVRYNKDYLVNCLAESDLSLERFDYSTETDGQSGIYFRNKRKEPSASLG